MINIGEIGTYTVKESNLFEEVHVRALVQQHFSDRGVAVVTRPVQRRGVVLQQKPTDESGREVSQQ